MTNLDATSGDELPQTAFESLVSADYTQAEALYQELVNQGSGKAGLDIKQYSWYLGLTLLLQGKEAEAQMAWMLAMMDGDEQEQEQWKGELIQILKAAVERQEERQEQTLAWVICQHIREVEPGDIANLLKLLQLSVGLGQALVETLEIDAILRRLKLDLVGELEAGSIAPSSLIEVLKNLLKTDIYTPWVVEFAEIILAALSRQASSQGSIPDSNILIYELMIAAMEAAYSGHHFQLALRYAELALTIEPQHLEVLSHIVNFYHELGQLDRAVETAEQVYSLSPTLPEKIHANSLIIRNLLRSGGQWHEALPKIEHQKELFRLLMTQKVISIDRRIFSLLSNCTFFLPYVSDAPQQNRSWHNQILELCQRGAQLYAQEYWQRFRDRHLVFQSHHSSKPEEKIIGKDKLKIGYLSHCLREHSVGWLARWLFQYHDRHQFDIYSYFVTYRADVPDQLQEWYVKQSTQARKMGRDGLEIAEQIYQDEIDILVDLDSITADITCEVVALKPAPIQVTWLGWDASGIPAIDYYLADPYVLPEVAQSYYHEKIWRLPHSYIAVDGFEVGVPTLRRADLDIPQDGIVYFSAQSGYKRHPDNVRLQMRILKAVPNSYFLLKDITKDVQQVQQFFRQIADEEGVDWERLRFLPKVRSEMIHRANLQIADVVLDTYPYNGATTTLETLWLGVPVVTLVGQQFSARNSYTMLINAGIMEGIAWTEADYLEWGIRFGTDEKLRRQVSWKLKQSRKTAPLWNGKQFAQDLEKAYQQMWQHWTES